MRNHTNQPTRLYVGLRADSPKLLVPQRQSASIPPGMMQSKATPLIIPQSSALWELRLRLRSLPIEESLGIISRLSWARITASKKFSDITAMAPQPGNTLREYQLAFLVKLLLDDIGALSLRRWSEETLPDRIGAVRSLAELVSQAVTRADANAREQSLDDAFAIVFRLANQQFPDFDAPGKLFARAVLLYQHCARQEERQQGVILSRVLNEEIGLTLEQALFIAYGFMATLGQSYREQYVNESFMTDSHDFPGLKKSHMENYFKWLSIKVSDFHDVGLQERYQAREGYELYNFNPLISFPILRMKDDRYCIPIASYFLRRAATGVYFDMIRSGKKGPAGSIIGKALEQYVAVLNWRPSVDGPTFAVD